MNQKTYTIEAGNVLRGGERIAAYNETTGAIEFAPGKANYRGPVVRFLREQGKAAHVANSPTDKPKVKPIEPGPAASKVGVNRDRPVEEGVAPLNPNGTAEEGAPELPPEAEAPTRAPRRPAQIGDTQVEMIKVAGQKVPYKSRLTPEGWV